MKRHLTWFALLALLAGCGGGESGNADKDASSDGASGECTGAADGTSCGDGQVCIAETCVASECGDGVIDAASGEECEDGNGTDGDGCDNDCTYSCHSDVDCSDLEPCNGEEVCSPELNRCQSGTVPDCDDGDECTADACTSGVGCEHTFIDGDLDGYSPYECKADGEHAGKGGDCNDDPDAAGGAQHPGMGESCNGGIDDDCDGYVDGDDPNVVSFCYRDADGDGVPDQADAVAGCSCPNGYMAPLANGRWDCKDDDADVFEGQTAYFAEPFCTDPNATATYGLGSCGIIGGKPVLCMRWSCSDASAPSFDYNCDTTLTKQYTAAGSTGCSPNALGRCSGGGWTTASAPACGTNADYRTCSKYPLCSETVATRTQTCR